MKQVIRVGGAAGFFADSGLNVPQLLEAGVDYLVFDALAESVMGRLAGQYKADNQTGWVRRFLDAQIGPYLHDIARGGVKVVSNAGGLNPRACAAEIRKRIAAEGLALKVASVEGDNLSSRVDAFAAAGLRDMDSGKPMAALLDDADEVLSFTAYTGAFPIAQALAQGADIVVTGRAVDTAPTLGVLIHEFGWGRDDFDLLAGGTAIGHLLECGSAAVGGTFTDWRDVPGWDDMGYPLAECYADGSAVITKPAGTGGLVTVGSLSEQLLYEVSDVGGYIAPDVVCDWTSLQLTQEGADRVRIFGARGLPRTPTYKACLTYTDGWKAVCAYPVIGVDAAAKAERMGQAILERTARLLRRRNQPDWRRCSVEVVGAESVYGPKASPWAGQSREVICRVAVDHKERSAAELFSEEAPPFIAHVVGASVPMHAGVSAIQKLGAFLVEKARVELSIADDAGRRRADVPADGVPPRPRSVAPPVAPVASSDESDVALLDLAWVRSGDKGDLANIAVIARKPDFLPYLARALTPDAVAKWYAHAFNSGVEAHVERQYAPGLHALNFVLRGVMGGGLAANIAMDACGKGLGQQFLDFPIPVPPEIAGQLDRSANKEAINSNIPRKELS